LIAELKRGGQLHRRSSSKISIKLPTHEDVKRAAQAQAQEASKDENDDHDKTISVRWGKGKKKRKRKPQKDEASVEHDEESLKSLFRGYGQIAHVVVRQKSRRALIVFTKKEEAILATQDKSKPADMSVEFMQEAKSKKEQKEKEKEKKTKFAEPLDEKPPKKATTSSASSTFFSSRSGAPTPPNARPLTSIVDHENYESQTLLRLQRLIEQQKLQQQQAQTCAATVAT